MKNFYSTNEAINSIRILIAMMILTLGMLQVAEAQVKVPFTQRSSTATPNKVVYNVKGDFTMIGNTNMTPQNYTPSGNNNLAMIYVDVDGDASTFNSSSATLTFSEENGAVPECSEIIYAGLYWTGRASRGPLSPMEFNVTKNGATKRFNKRQVKFKHASGEYQTITALPNDIYFPESTESLMYSAYAEVTDIVKANGLGEYLVADIALIEGTDTNVGLYGGWGMVVVYENSKMNWRDVTVFDGHAYVTGSQTLEYQIPIDGFQTAQNGDINIKLGVMAGEGDEDITGNFLEIERGVNTNNFLRLSHSGNTADNFFNSSIMTGGNPRTPNLVNNTGMDIAMFNIPNTNNAVISNGQTSTKFRYGSTRDRYIIFNLTFSVDAYVPDIVGANKIVTINGQEVSDTNLAVLPGQEVGFQVAITNSGTEQLEDVEVIIPLPFTASHVKTTGQIFFPDSNSGEAYFDPSSGSYGSIIWKIGSLPLPASFGEERDFVLATLNYTLRATDDCLILMVDECKPFIPVQGGISGRGTISQSPFNNLPFTTGYQEEGACVGEPIFTPLNIYINVDEFDAAECANLREVQSFEFCSVDGEFIPLSEISSQFPNGLRFFDKLPGDNIDAIEFTAQNPFPATPGVSQYYALPAGLTGLTCAFTFQINIKNITTTPQIIDYVICQGDDLADLPLPVANIGHNGNPYNLYVYVNKEDEDALFMVDTLDRTQLNRYVAEFRGSEEFFPAGDYVFYIAEGYSADCIGEKLAFNVKVVDQINAPSIENQEVEVGEGVASFLATASEGLTLEWYADPEGKEKLEEAPSISLDNPGVFTAYVSQTSDGSCNSIIVPVMITVSGEYSLSVTKTANVDSLPALGEEIVYTIVVENTGNVSLSNISILDPLTGLDELIETLQPGEAVAFTTSYTVTQQDIENGEVVNIATASTEDPEEKSITAEDTITIKAPTAPVEPVDPIDPIDPTDPTVPTDPTDPVDPIDPIDPIDPTDPTNPTDPTEPTEPTDPEEPTITILANDDQFGSLMAAQGGILGNILNNDLLNGSAVKSDEVDFTFIDLDGVIGLIIEEDGTLSILPEAAEPREYRLIYELRETKNPSNKDLGNVTFRVMEAVNLELTKTVNTTSILVGEMVTYTLILTNNGTQPVENISVADLLPEELMFISSNLSGTEDLVYNIASLAPGASVTIIIEAMGVAAGEVVNTATATVGDTQVVANAPTVTIKEPLVDMHVTKTSSNAEIFEGDTFTYEIVVQNRGEIDATNVVVTDRLPDNLTFVSQSHQAVGLSLVLSSVGGNLINYIIPDFPVGAQLTISIVVKAGNAGSVINGVEVSSDQEDLNPVDNMDTDENTIKAIFFPNVITPNGDGKNDMFIINGLSKFESNKIVIFNRWGDHVFEADNYKNNWSAEGLNSGTYFYVLVSKDSNGQETTFKGWVQVIKNTN